MHSFIIISIIMYIIVGIVFVCLNFSKIRKKNVAYPNQEYNAQDLLANINEESDAFKIATLFVGLMSCSYILVHIMTNEGNKYDDKIQSKSFNNSLETELMQRLLKLEGKYE